MLLPPSNCCELLLAAGNAAANPPLPMWIPMVLIFVAFYFILMRPQRKREADATAMRESLKQNDRVVTIGGIHGVVVSTSKDSDSLMIRVDENTRIRIQRDAVARVESDKKEAK